MSTRGNHPRSISILNAHVEYLSCITNLPYEYVHVIIHVPCWWKLLYLLIDELFYHKIQFPKNVWLYCWALSNVPLRALSLVAS